MQSLANSTSIHTSQVLTSFLERRRIDSLVFPLKSFLQLYQKLQYLEYSRRLEAARDLIKWLSPISISDKQSIFVPTYFCTPEIQFLAEALREEPSKIWQELVELGTLVPQKIKPKRNYHCYNLGTRRI